LQRDSCSPLLPHWLLRVPLIPTPLPSPDPRKHRRCGSILLLTSVVVDLSWRIEACGQPVGAMLLRVRFRREPARGSIGAAMARPASSGITAANAGSLPSLHPAR